MSGSDVDLQRRFGGLDRLYGEGALARLGGAHACVIGIGGVGSWVAEALARSGVGALTLIDLDHIAESNINRQVHALDDTLGQAKVEAMAARIHAINPNARLTLVDAFIAPDNAAELLLPGDGSRFDVVLDAIDQVRAKVAVAALCHRQRIPLVIAGGAGGKRDPGRLQLADLSATEQDPLLAKVRRALRAEHGFPRDSRRRFGLQAVYSDEPVRYPDAACDAQQALQGLACAGYGSSVMMTAGMGLRLAACAVEILLARAVV